MPYWTMVNEQGQGKFLWYEPPNGLGNYPHPVWNFGHFPTSAGDIVIGMSPETADICPTNGNIEEAIWFGSPNWAEKINQYVSLECKFFF